MWTIRMIIVTCLLTGCSTPVTDRMDAWFNSLNRPSNAQPDPMEYKNKPGYAPAYPAYDRFEQSDPLIERDETPAPIPLYR